MRIQPEVPLLKSAGLRADREGNGELRQACREFEGLLLEQMLAAMRRSVPESGLFGSSPAAEIYASLRDQDLAKELAGQGGIGLADALYRQLVRKDGSTP